MSAVLSVYEEFYGIVWGQGRLLETPGDAQIPPGSTVDTTGYPDYAKHLEGGFSIDYTTPQGEQRRLVLGYTELGVWTYYNGKREVGHAWRWSREGDGSATCIICGAQRRLQSSGGPRGGSISLYRARLTRTWGGFKRTPPPCR